MGSSILITGASGFLGSHMLPFIIRNDRRTVCLGRGKPAVSAEPVDFVVGDLLDREACRRALDGCDTVIHLAAATGKQPPREYFRVNRDGTEVLVREAQRAGVRRFLYISTIAAKFQEISRYYYAQSKQQAEAIVAQSGLCWTIVRPTMILGPGSPVLAALRKLAALPAIPVFGNGRALVQPVFVDDAASMIADILDASECNGHTVEIGGPQVLTIEQLLLRMRRKIGISNSKVVHLPARPIAICLGWMEPVLGSLLPFTAGQLASFTNPGTAAEDLCVARRPNGMRSIDVMLQSLAEDNGSA